MAKRRPKTEIVIPKAANYDGLFFGISQLLDQSRRTTARAINSVLTATYREIGRRIVEHEQGGQARAEYGERLLKRLAGDLSARFGRGFAWRNLFYMRSFFLGREILQTSSAKCEARVKLPPEMRSTAESKGPTLSGDSRIAQTPSAQSVAPAMVAAFPLSWSHYVRLMSVEKLHARAFYEAEAIRDGWSVRQLDRQISTQFFDRTAGLRTFQGERDTMVCQSLAPASFRGVRLDSGWIMLRRCVASGGSRELGRF